MRRPCEWARYSTSGAALLDQRYLGVMTSQALRFGIVGTGGWSNHSHIPGARSSPRVDFVGAIGRNDDFGKFLDTVDAVGFAVPPDVQAPLALQAARAGKHVLFDKPIALDLDEAQTLASTIEDAGLASIVFLTRRFVEPVARWIDDLAGTGGWSFGRAEILTAALADMPNPGWRAERGGLWDLGPHALSLLCGALGPVVSVSATRSASDLVTTSLVHESGATSVMSTSISLPPSAGGGDDLLFLGESGRSVMPEIDEDAQLPERAYARAIAALVDQVEGASPGHPCDARFGAQIVRILDAAERSIDTRTHVDL